MWDLVNKKIEENKNKLPADPRGTSSNKGRRQSINGIAKANAIGRLPTMALVHRQSTNVKMRDNDKLDKRDAFKPRRLVSMAVDKIKSYNYDQFFLES